ncbi:cytochrome P450 [Streptomyces albospinus]|uniref:Cytochrome P450 n=1 Tax=Streptomyces albospinus TaxID=285515 RepID=A0ABQ2VP26_9ACTN|nr:cytochrome P450 [Streptomyces albospinus]GGV02801.1 cytochrome P450 [Streptomyces albospinus]
MIDPIDPIEQSPSHEPYPLPATALVHSLDPWPAYDRLLTHPRLYQCQAERTYIVARHADVQQALRHPHLSVGFPMRATRQLFGPTAIDLDGARHRSARHLVSWFSASRMNTWVESAVAPVVDDLAGQITAKAPVDVVAVLGHALPVRVICRVLGLPDEEWPWLRRKLRPIVAYISNQATGLEEALTARLELTSRIEESLAAQLPSTSVLRRLWPDATVKPPPDTTHELTEHMRAVLLLLAAGTATTTMAISNLFWCLLQHPDTWTHVASGQLSPSAVVAESLRLRPPLHSTVRFATRELTLAGTPIPRGSRVQVLLAAANRDPAVFDAPDRWNPHRPARLAPVFGNGPHACAGAQLALSELCLLLDALSQRFGTISPGAPADALQSAPFHHHTSLSVVFHSTPVTAPEHHREEPTP